MNDAAATGVQTLDRRRVYIFLSRAGITLGVMLIIILLGAINYDNALGYLLAFLLGGMVMVAMLHTYLNLAGMRFHGARATPVYAGEQAEFECIIENPTARPRLQLNLRYWPHGLDRAAKRYLRRFETRFQLPAGQTVAVPVRVDADRRGWLPLDRVLVETRYPLGILTSWAYFRADAHCLVYPHPHGKLPLPEMDIVAQGNTASAATGTDDFAGLRAYRPGDPVRAIAWKTLAKEQELMVKRFHGETAAQVWLAWQDTARLGDTEARLSQMAAWVLHAHRAGASWGMALPGETVEFARGSNHLDHCLGLLALFENPA